MNTKFKHINRLKQKRLCSVALITALLPISPLAEAAETLPWRATFSVPDGETFEDAPTSWTAIRNNGSFDVQDSELALNDAGTEGVFTSGVIDISDGAVTVSLDLESQGNLESSQDYVKLFKKVDGGSEVLIGEKWGVQSATSIAANSITGNTLQLVIRAYVSYRDEFYYLDNVSVNQLSTEPNPIPDPNPTPISMQSEHTYAKNEGPYKNPLKGWNSGWDGDNDYPESSVGFQYIKWKDFEPRDGSFDRSAVEAIIDNEGSKNRHLILRLYCDWHGNDYQSDCPDWMYTDAGVARLQGDNGRYITDFNDSEYIAQAQEAIQALATQYDNDPRIYAVQMGVLGYWGEWHTSGSSFSENTFNIMDSTKNAILSTYTASFNNAKIMARYPWREPTQSASGIGFHNDFFVTNDSHSAAFDTAVTTGGQWTSNPIGGEVPPRKDYEVNNEKTSLFSGDEGRTMLETGHYSTMKPGSYRVTQGERFYEDYMRLHKSMGYNYQIDVAKFPESINTSEQLAVDLIGTNIGVAPMYFDWDVQFALLDENDNPVIIENSSVDLTSILPDAMFTFSSNIDVSTVTPQAYTLAVRIIQPGADRAKEEPWKLDARNTYILFSNDLAVVNGVWENNILMGGWSILGDVTVQ